jgi:hypothetical protein
MAGSEDIKYAMKHIFKVPSKREFGERDRLYSMILLSVAKRRVRSAVARLWNLEPTPGEQKLVRQMILILTDLQNRTANGSPRNNTTTK